MFADLIIETDEIDPGEIVQLIIAVLEKKFKELS